MNFDSKNERKYHENLRKFRRKNGTISCEFWCKKCMNFTVKNTQIMARLCTNFWHKIRTENGKFLRRFLGKNKEKAQKYNIIFSRKSIYYIKYIANIIKLCYNSIEKRKEWIKYERFAYEICA